jgi:oligoribonuclease NrnB/cAMP/cGMP phosphodiesterase (DHH superfamily)
MTHRRSETAREATGDYMDTIVYHGDCPDGFCSAFIASTRAYSAAKMVSATYGKPIDDADVRGKRVLVVDFSWKRAEMERIAALTENIVVLDHHKTAEAELVGLPYCTFDMERSGAQLSWDFIYGDQPRPWYVDYVADRDLWRWQLPESRVVSAYIMALPHTIEAWKHLDKIGVEDAITLGRGARMQIEHYIEKVTAQGYVGTFGARSMKIVNAPYPNISDVGNALCEQGADIGVGWFIRGDGMMQFSLRSIGDLDVSDIAKVYGGGGHRNAAGFQVDEFAGRAILKQWTHQIMEHP